MKRTRRLTVYLPMKLIQRLKVSAARQGVTLSTLVERALARARKAVAP